MAAHSWITPGIGFRVLPWVAFFFTGHCLAAAAWMTESGGADMGMASAGRAALAADASTLAANPAGMAALDGDSYLVATLPTRLDLTLDGSGAVAGSVDNHAGTMPVGALFATHSAGRWTVGLGLYSYLGVGLDFRQDWAGSRAIEDLRVRTVNIAPAAAYRLTDRLDVGATLGAQYADFRAGLGVANDAMFYGPPVGLPDGRLRLDGNSWAVNGSLGLSYRPGEDSRIGLAWQSQVGHAVGLDLRGEGLHPVLESILAQDPTARLDLAVPQQVTLSAVQQVTPDTLLAANVSWQDWSALGGASLEIAGNPAPVFDDGLRDTWGVALGLRHRLDERWTISAGAAYDSDPAPHSVVPVYFPVAEQLRLALGVDYRYTPRWLFRAAVSVVNQGTVQVAQESYPVPLPGIPPVTGRIEGSRIYVIGLAVDYRP
jgi:long-chain fatty acid transport protein